MIGKDILMGGFDRIYEVVGSSKTLNTAMRRLCRNPYSSLRATGGSVAISLFSTHYGIASVVSLSRSDIMTQPRGAWQRRVLSVKWVSGTM